MATNGLVWTGVRVTFGCGHMELRDDNGTADIGSLGVCWVCPLRERAGIVRGPGSPSWAAGHVAAIRHIVNVEPLTLTRAPGHLAPEHWH